MTEAVRPGRSGKGLEMGEHDIVERLRVAFQVQEESLGPDPEALLLEAADEIERLSVEVALLMDGMEMAWGLIANARNWDATYPRCTTEWSTARATWRDDYWHPALTRNRPTEADDG